MMKQGNGRAAKRRMGLIFALLVMAVMVLGLSAAAAQVAFPEDAGVLFEQEGDWEYGQTPPTPYIFDWDKNTKYDTDGEIIYKYYRVTENGPVETTTENSGADSVGGIPRKVGSYEVRATVKGTDNYAGGEALGEFPIVQAEPKASLFSFTVSPDTIYDGQAKSVVITSAETVGEITVHYFQDGNPVTAPTLPGNYTFKIDVGENEQSNYKGKDDITDDSWKFTIAPKTLTLKDIIISTKTYDGTKAATISGTPTLEGIVGTEDVSLSGTGTATFKDANVGTDKEVTISGLTLTGVDNSHYTLATTATGSITAKEVTVTGIIADKVYDGTKTATLDCSKAVVEGTLGGEKLTVSATTGTFEDKDVGPQIQVRISGITLAGEGAGNYVAADAKTIAAITPKTLTVTGLTVVSKPYDATTDATVTGTPVLNGIVGTDDVKVSVTKASFQDAEWGEGKTVTITGLTLGGEDADNYTLPDPALTLTGSITKRAVTVAANPQTILLGGSIATGTEWATLSGAAEGHTLAAVTLTASSSEQATSQGTITPSAAIIKNLSDDVTDNYEITYTAGTLTVNKLPKEEIPAAPTLASGTATSITLNAVAGCEYSMDRKTWQAETTFSGLESSKTYSFYQRYKEDETHTASSPSEGAAFQTAAAVIECSIAFDANGGSGTMEPLRTMEGTGVKLPKNAFTREAYGFTGWNTAADGSGKAYGEEDSLTATADMTLYAQWIQYTVTFDAQNGQAAAPLAATPNQPIGKPEDPTLAGYTFRGWWFAAQDGTAAAYDFSTPVSGNLTLWGCWEWAETIEIPKSRTYLLTAPAENVTFTSSAPKYLAVSDAGEVSALEMGGINVQITGSLHAGIPAYSWPVAVKPYGFRLSESTIKIAPKGQGSFRIEEYYLPGDSIASVTSGDPTQLKATAEGDVITVESLSTQSGSYYVYILNRAGQNSQSVLVTVEEEETPEIKLSAVTVSIKDRETATVKVKKYSAQDDAIETVESNNPEIATATFEGDTITVKPVGNGKATLSVITKKGAVGKIVANVSNMKVKFSTSSVTISGKGTATVQVIDLGNDKIKTVESGDESVATATFKGDLITVTAEGFGEDGKGKTEITVTTRSGARGVFNVKVNSSGLKFEDDKITIPGLGTKKAGVVLNDGDALEKVQSSNEQVFTATIKGKTILLTGRRFGEASLTAYTKKGGMKRIKVTVVSSEIDLTPDSLTFQGIEKKTVKMESSVDEDTVESVIFKLEKGHSKRNVVKAKFNGKEITFIPRKPGKTEATVTAYSGGTKTIKMTVESANLTCSPKKVQTDGRRQTVTVTSSWEGDTIERLEIDDEGVAKATFKGNKITVTPMAAGGTDIHVISRKGGTATFHVKVSSNGNFKMAHDKKTPKVTKIGQQGVYFVTQWEHEGDALERVCSTDEHVVTAEINKKDNTVTVTGVGVGKANIAVFTREGSLTTLKLKVDGEKLSFTGSTRITDGQKTVLSPNQWPTDGDYLESAAPFDADVIKVSCDRNTITVTPKNAGKTEILVTTHAGYTAEIEMTVEDNGFRLTESRLIFENMKKQTVRVRTFSPSDRKIRSVESANKKIATATFKDDVITVTPHKKGKTTITVSTKKSTATFAVTVK